MRWFNDSCHQTAVNISESIESPLYGGHDSLNLDQILLTTETFVYNYLHTAELPECQEERCLVVRQSYRPEA
eukprot:2062973-Amphidinium_carterae.1